MANVIKLREDKKAVLLVKDKDSRVKEMAICLDYWEVVNEQE